MRIVGVLLVCAVAARAGDGIEAALKKVRPAPAEERWKLIGLGDSLVLAQKKAKEENKPIYYFGADGVLASGNC